MRRGLLVYAFIVFVLGCSKSSQKPEVVAQPTQVSQQGVNATSPQADGCLDDADLQLIQQKYSALDIKVVVDCLELAKLSKARSSVERNFKTAIDNLLKGLTAFEFSSNKPSEITFGQGYKYDVQKNAIQMGLARGVSADQAELFFWTALKLLELERQVFKGLIHFKISGMGSVNFNKEIEVVKDGTTSSISVNDGSLNPVVRDQKLLDEEISNIEKFAANLLRLRERFPTVYLTQNGSPDEFEVEEDSYSVSFTSHTSKIEKFFKKLSAE